MKDKASLLCSLQERSSYKSCDASRDEGIRLSAILFPKKKSLCVRKAACFHKHMVLCWCNLIFIFMYKELMICSTTISPTILGALSGNPNTRNLWYLKTRRHAMWIRVVQAWHRVLFFLFLLSWRKACCLGYRIFRSPLFYWQNFHYLSGNPQRIIIGCDYGMLLLRTEETRSLQYGLWKQDTLHAKNACFLHLLKAKCAGWPVWEPRVVILTVWNRWFAE